MALLDLLQKRPGLRLVVAHYDHGIRSDSQIDMKLVQDVAKIHKLPFVHAEGKLEQGTSEAAARTARYNFLNSVKQASGAQAIITAHHQDDVLETAIINLLRGTGRRGLTALGNQPELVRPLLGYDKAQIRDYAIEHGLKWREDPTNTDIAFTRNYIRHKVMPKFSLGQRAQLLILLEELAAINLELNTHLEGLLHIQPALNKLDRAWFISLPHDIAKELLHSWLRKHGVRNITRPVIDRLVVAMKTKRPGQKIDVDQKHVLKIAGFTLALMPRDR